MGCCGSKGGGKKAAKYPDDKFIDETVIDKLKIEDFDNAFEKSDTPLAGLIDINNKYQTAIEQLMAAASALFGGFLTEATIKDGKVSFEIYKPPEKKDDKKVVIAVVEGGSKGKGIDIKNKGLYNAVANRLAKEDFVAAMDTINEQIESFNKIVADKGVKLEIKMNRVAAPKEKPKDPVELAKLNAVVDAANQFNTVYFPVKIGLAKAAFKDELGIRKIVMQILDKLKAAVGDLVPKVNVDLAGLAEGKLNFDIGMGEYANINEVFDKSDLIPPMLKKAWDCIYGTGGLIDCLKEVAAAAKELKPQIEAAVETLKALPTDPKEITEKAKAANLKPMEISGVPEKFKNNVDQLSRTPDIMKAFMDNLESTVEQLAEAVQDFAKDSGANK